MHPWVRQPVALESRPVVIRDRDACSILSCVVRTVVVNAQTSAIKATLACALAPSKVAPARKNRVRVLQSAVTYSRGREIHRVGACGISYDVASRWTAVVGPLARHRLA